MTYSRRLVTAWLLLLVMMIIAAATYRDVLLASDLIESDQLVSQPPGAAGFIETWEAAATSRLPEGPWQLTSGVWGSVAQQDVRGAGRKYAVAPGQVSQLQRAVSVSGQDHVVVEGWLEDPGQGTHSMLGLASSEMVEDAATMRIGSAGQDTYRVQYYEAQGSTSTMRDIDTGAAVEPGWHWLRLDLVRDRDVPNSWLAKWRIWNAARASRSGDPLCCTSTWTPWRGPPWDPPRHRRRATPGTGSASARSTWRDRRRRCRRPRNPPRSPPHNSTVGRSASFMTAIPTPSTRPADTASSRVQPNGSHSTSAWLPRSAHCR